ncbi:hypothetical protein QBC47DRAFT_376926 [Echria macrotheca]|uniref:C2H2-type domain-containing protein n=1 Tax=Echria macrotheca TaxID=438768 RepID=A0AAJ0BIF5_9PEZI|nr:hypothetical protein QBC47DRAFT_376926 [Echria macrotheca]
MDPFRPRRTPDDGSGSDPDPSRNGARGRSGFIADPVELIRETIMPRGPQWKSGEPSDPWEVEITLLPSSAPRTRPVEYSREYSELKSRGLITTVIIPARDAASFTTTVSRCFRAALEGREWVPLRSLENPIDSTVYLKPSLSAVPASEQNFEFLVEECLIESHEGRLSLFIAPKSGRLSWDLIRQLPRVDQPELPPANFKPTPPLPTKSDASAASETPPDLPLTSASNNAASRAPSDKPPPPAKIEADSKGKFRCPDSKCPRSRVPFTSRDVCIEHWENKHKGSVVKEVDIPVAGQQSPSTSSAATNPVGQLGRTHDESVKPSFAKPHASSERATASEDSVPVPNRQLRPSTTEDGIEDSTRTTLSDSTALPTVGCSVATSGPTPPSESFIHGPLPLRSHAENSTNTSGSPASRPSDRTTSSNPNGRPGRKRRRITEGDEPSDDRNGDDDDGDNGEDKESGENANHADPAKLWACPFFKKDPDRYLSCAGGRWPLFHRVKEHLFRKHDLQHQCSRCWQRFKTKELLTEHSRAETVCALKTQAESPDDVTPQQIEQLKRRKRDGSSDAERWNSMFKILFPTIPDDEIPSPCEFYSRASSPELTHTAGNELPDQGSSLDDYRKFVANPPEEWTQRAEQMFTQVCQEHRGLSEEVCRSIARRILAKLPQLQRQLIGAFTREEAATCGEASPPSSLAGDGGGNMSELLDTGAGAGATEMPFLGDFGLDFFGEQGAEGFISDEAYNTTASTLGGPEMRQAEGNSVVPRHPQHPFSESLHAPSHAAAEQTESYDAAWLQSLTTWQDHNEEAVLD